MGPVTLAYAELLRQYQVCWLCVMIDHLTCLAQFGSVTAASFVFYCV